MLHMSSENGTDLAQMAEIEQIGDTATKLGEMFRNS
jgi:hypothetical protein